MKTIKLHKNEIAKDITGYEDSYLITNLGRVISKPFKRNRNYRLLKHSLNKYGYPVISLGKKEKRKQFFVHRLIAINFINNPQNKYYINHINAIKTDFSISNLEWCTNLENMQHAHSNGLIPSCLNSKNKLNKSGLLGVSWNTSKKKWVAQIYNNKKKCYIGSFHDKKEAGIAYDDFVLEHIGENGSFNFR